MEDELIEYSTTNTATKDDESNTEDAVVVANNNNNNNNNNTLPVDFPWVPIGHPDSMMSKESVRRAIEDFHVQPSDVIVATFPKTGTTLVTWICHLLRTSAPSNVWDTFDTLYEVVPWPTLSWDIGYDPNVNGSQFVPRVFKSHLKMSSIYRGCKYVVTIRDPASTTLSFYNFFLAKKVPLALELEHVSDFLTKAPFLQGIKDQRPSLWDYYSEYHLLKDCPAVLVLIYEDLVADMPRGIRMLAEFMNIAVNDDLVERVAKMSTKESMAQHTSKFDEPYERAKKLGRAADLSQLAPGTKIALHPHPQTFNEEAKEFLWQKWNETMLPLGYKDYTSFANTFRETHKLRFEKAYSKS